MPRLNPVRRMPWVTVLHAGYLGYQQWSDLPDRDRRRLQKLVKKSRGLPMNLTTRERDEVKRIVKKLDLPSIGKQLAPVPGVLKRRRAGR